MHEQTRLEEVESQLLAILVNSQPGGDWLPSEMGNVDWIDLADYLNAVRCGIWAATSIVRVCGGSATLSELSNTLGFLSDFAWYRADLEEVGE